MSVFIVAVDPSDALARGMRGRVARETVRDTVRLLTLVDRDDHFFSILDREEDGGRFIADGVLPRQARAAMAGLTPEDTAAFEHVVAFAEAEGRTVHFDDGTFEGRSTGIVSVGDRRGTPSLDASWASVWPLFAGIPCGETADRVFRADAVLERCRSNASARLSSDVAHIAADALSRLGADAMVEVR